MNVFPNNVLFLTFWVDQNIHLKFPHSDLENVSFVGVLAE